MGGARRPLAWTLGVDLSASQLVTGIALSVLLATIGTLGRASTARVASLSVRL